MHAQLKEKTKTRKNELSYAEDWVEWIKMKVKIEDYLEFRLQWSTVDNIHDE